MNATSSSPVSYRLELRSGSASTVYSGLSPERAYAELRSVLEGELGLAERRWAASEELGAGELRYYVGLLEGLRAGTAGPRAGSPSYSYVRAGSLELVAGEPLEVELRLEEGSGSPFVSAPLRTARELAREIAAEQGAAADAEVARIRELRAAASVEAEAAARAAAVEAARVARAEAYRLRAPELEALEAAARVSEARRRLGRSTEAGDLRARISEAGRGRRPELEARLAELEAEAERELRERTAVALDRDAETYEAAGLPETAAASRRAAEAARTRVDVDALPAGRYLLELYRYEPEGGPLESVPYVRLAGTAGEVLRELEAEGASGRELEEAASALRYKSEYPAGGAYVVSLEGAVRGSYVRGPGYAVDAVPDEASALLSALPDEDAPASSPAEAADVPTSPEDAALEAEEAAYRARRGELSTELSARAGELAAEYREARYGLYVVSRSRPGFLSDNGPELAFGLEAVAAVLEREIEAELEAEDDLAGPGGVAVETLAGRAEYLYAATFERLPELTPAGSGGSALALDVSTSETLEVRALPLGEAVELGYAVREADVDNGSLLELVPAEAAYEVGLGLNPAEALDAAAGARGALASVAEAGLAVLVYEELSAAVAGGYAGTVAEYPEGWRVAGRAALRELGGPGARYLARLDAEIAALELDRVAYYALEAASSGVSETYVRDAREAAGRLARRATSERARRLAEAVANG